MKILRVTLLSGMLLALAILLLAMLFSSIIAVATSASAQLPIVKDSSLMVEKIVGGLPGYPTSMDFLDNDHILVSLKNVPSKYEIKSVPPKDEAPIYLISNRELEEQPVLTVPVNYTGEGGLLGIAVNRNNFDGPFGSKLGTSDANKSKITVFLYFTELDAGKPTRNRVYGYQWNGTKLVNPTLILDLERQINVHRGGKLLVGPDNYLYAVIGDLNHKGQLQNIKDGPAPDNTSVILRVNPNDGSAAKDNPFVVMILTSRRIIPILLERQSTGITDMELEIVLD